jgi:hypothetical protein
VDILALGLAGSGAKAGPSLLDANIILCATSFSAFFEIGHLRDSFKQFCLLSGEFRKGAFLGRYPGCNLYVHRAKKKDLRYRNSLSNKE